MTLGNRKITGFKSFMEAYKSFLNAKYIDEKDEFSVLVENRNNLRGQKVRLAEGLEGKVKHVNNGAILATVKTEDYENWLFADCPMDEEE